LDLYSHEKKKKTKKKNRPLWEEKSPLRTKKGGTWELRNGRSGACSRKGGKGASSDPRERTEEVKKVPVPTSFVTKEREGGRS